MAAWIALRGEDEGPFFPNRDRTRKGDRRLGLTSVARIVEGAGQRIGRPGLNPATLRRTGIA
jgi:hypothetical protein